MRAVGYLGPLAPLGSKGTYTPVWSSTGTQPVLNNGTITGQFAIDGAQLTFAIALVMGSTTTYGTGVYGFSLPSWITTAAIYQIVSGKAIDLSASSTETLLAPSVGPSQASVFPIAHAGVTNLVGPTVPFTFANGDQVYISGAVLLA